jgi:hypothetical protein
MTILNQPQVPQVDPAVRAANMLKNNVRQTFNMMVQAFNQGAKNFWINPQVSPEQISAALGTDAKEVFELHAKLGQLLASVKPESIAEGSSVVGNFTINDDGTVTVIPPTILTPNESN